MVGPMWAQAIFKTSDAHSQVHGVEASLLANVRQVTFAGPRAGEGYFSADGTKIVFQSERERDNPFYQIYHMDLATGVVQRVSPGDGKTTCAWIHPTTGQVLYASTHEDPSVGEKAKAEKEERETGKERRYAWSYDDTFDLFLANPDGTDAKKLTTAKGYDAECAVSPDGRHVVFSSNRHIYEEQDLSDEDKKRLELDPAYFCELYQMDIDGSNVVRLTDAPGYDGGPFYTTTGEIVWRRFDEPGLIADVYLMKTDGSNQRRVTNFESMSWAPFMHPSGKYIVFASNKLGFTNFEVYMVDSEGKKQPVRVTESDGFDGLPVFSPQGDKLLWTSVRGASEKGSSAAGSGGQLFLAEWNHQAALAALGLAAEAAPNDAKIAPALSPAQALSPERLLETDKVLAGDPMKGRETGTDGEKLAAEYLAGRLKAAGLVPLDKDGDYLEPYSFQQGVSLGADNRVVVTNKQGEERSLKLASETMPVAFSASKGAANAEVVFCGYGLNTQLSDRTYDSFAGLDITGKWALVLQFAPEDAEGEARRELFRFAGSPFKVMQARQRGAAGVILVHGPNSSGKRPMDRLIGDRQAANEGGIPVFRVSPEIADGWLRSGTGQGLKEWQDSLDDGQPVPGKKVEGITVNATVDLRMEDGHGYNILAGIPMAGGVEATTEWVAAGAHYDHLGYGNNSFSLAKDNEQGRIHPGADDNASGSSVTLGLAEAFMLQGPPTTRGLMFCWWSGEEMGLLGSNSWLKNPTVPKEKIVAYVNMDMVGRLTQNTLAVEGTGSALEWRHLVEGANAPVGMMLMLDDSPYVPTDSTAFYTNEIPSIQIFTGVHDDYHRPGDTWDKVNAEGLARIGWFAQRLITLLQTETITYVKVERGMGGGGRDSSSRIGARVTLGTIPDYIASEKEKGMKLSGVRADSPAEKAGLQAGDRIVELDGKEITNIYDLMYMLETLKPDKAIKIVYFRGDKKVEGSITPTVRK